MAKNLWYGDITRSTDWGGDASTDNLPVAGQVVQKYIKDEFNNFDETVATSIKLNTIGEDDDKKFSISILNKNGDIIETTDQFSGGGNAQVTKIVLTKLTDVDSVKLGDEVKLKYKYDQIDSTTEESTGNPANITITITRGSNTDTITKTVQAGSINEIDVTDFMVLGYNTVKVKAVVGEGVEQQTSTITWTINAVELVLTSSFNYAITTNRNDNILVPYYLTGSGVKTLRCYVDGVDTEDKSIAASTSNGSFTINTTSLTHGTHSIQLVAELELTDGSIIKSNSIYFGVAIKEEGNTNPIVVSRFDYTDGDIVEAGENPYINVKQYEYYTLRYSVYDPTKTPTSVEIYEGDKLVSSSSIPFVEQEYQSRSDKEGTIECKIKASATEYKYSLNVSKSDIDIVEPTDNLQLKLSASGRTNNDVDKEVWEYNDITTTFEGFKWGGDGWIDNALHLTDTARATVNYQPLKQPSINANNNVAIFIKYKVTEVIDETAPVIQCVDTDGTGFIITAQEIKMQTKGKNSLSMKTAAENVYEVAFVSFPSSGDLSSSYEKENTDMLYLYINGIMSGAVQRASSDTIYQTNPKNIEFGSDKATLDVYTIKAYSDYLTDTQVLDSYILNQNSIDDIFTKYEENNVIDINGNVSVDTVPNGMRYIIITGKQDNGVATVLQAAVNNDKSAKYNVDEMLCIKKGSPELNFKLIGGCIRLQGTSSLAYPIKNYRIYFKDANKKKGQLYLGCDEQGQGGELQEEVKYSFRPASSTQKAAAPVDCWCLKADFAESSSSHNTGLAKLVQNTLTAADELTPAQKYVSEDYQYDVRTTVDGEPCYLFYRTSIDETPIFLGKYNFNNDKSTEDVFGFLDIPGYHDQQWVTEKFNGENPTECWEFLNNDYPMGMFLDDDFDSKGSDGKPNWMKVFEARFPDDDDRNAQFEAGTLKPEQLEKTVKWIKSTKDDGSKFKAELADYFDVKYLCDYYMFTEIFGCVDQRVKNMMLGFWYNPDVDKVLGYFIFYDNDTILGVRNDGRLKYSWDVDENTIDEELSTSEKTVYAYAGHDSVLWKNLREQFADELQEAYVRIRNVMTNDTIFNMFDTEQSSKFCERIYNLDAINKYVIPKTIGVEVVTGGSTSNVKYSYLEAMQGNRYSHRHWWVDNRTGLLDAKFSTGDYYSTDITYKGNSEAGATIKATPARSFYFEFKRESTTLVHEKVEPDTEWSYTYEQMANIGTIFHLYGGKWMKKLNLAEWGGFTDLTLPILPILEELILGNASKTYNLTELVISNKLPMLKTLTMVNYAQLPTIDLSGCTRLETLDATGCTALSSVTFAEGAPLKSFKMPANYQSLYLKSMQYITKEGLEFENKSSVTSLWVDNCKQLDGYELFKELYALGNLKYVRITGLNLSGDGSDLTKYYEAKLGGIDAAGNLKTDKCKLVGTYQLTDYLDDDLYDKYVEYFDELNIKQPAWTCIEFADDEPDPKNVSNLDNQTGYNFDNDYEPSGHIKRILSLRHRVLSKVSKDDDKMYYYPLHDETSYKYADATDKNSCTDAKLDGTEGDFDVYEPHYWYKGVNDILGTLAGDSKPKKWQFYSTYNEKPEFDSSEMKIITYKEAISVPKAVIEKKYVKVDKETYTEASSNFYNIISVAIDNKYSKIRIPFSKNTGDLITGIVFLDSNNSIIEKINYADYSLSIGDYIIMDIPENSIKVNITFFILDEEYYDIYPDIIFSNSTDPYDWEPECMEHKETLFSAVSNYKQDDGTYIAKVDSSYSSNYYKPDKTTFKSAGKVRHRRAAEIYDFMMIANLVVAKYGNRNSQAIFGYHLNGNIRNVKPGITALYGMQDSFVPNELITNDIYIRDEYGDQISIPTTNILGYDSYCHREYGDKTSDTPLKQYKGENNTLVGFILKLNGHNYLLKPFSSVYAKSITNNKFMSIVTSSSESGTSDTYYCDKSNSWYMERYLGEVEGFYFGPKMSGEIVNKDAGVFSMVFEYISELSNLRFAYEGEMTKCASPEEFKNIQNFY